MDAPPFLTASAPVPPYAWDDDRLRLWQWFRVFLAMWLGGAVLWITGAMQEIESLAGLGSMVFLGAIVPYVGSLVYAYRVQDALHREGLYKGGAWQIVVGGLFLNPFFLGFAIPASVLSAVRRVERDLGKGILRPFPR